MAIPKNEWGIGADYSVARIPTDQSCPTVIPLSFQDRLLFDAKKAAMDALKNQDDLRQKISLREAQIKTVTGLPSRRERRLMAQIIEKSLSILSGKEVYYFQKESQKVPVSFVVNLSEKLIYLFLEDSLPEPHFRTYAETRSAIALPVDGTQKAYTSTYRISLTGYDDDARVNPRKSAEQAWRLFKEHTIIRSYSCFLQARCDFQFKEVEQDIFFDKICVVQDCYESAARFSFYSVSDKCRATIVRQLAAGLALLHKDGRIHGNVKPVSIVFRKDSDNHFEFKWTDAAFSTTCVGFPQSIGFYGHPSSTPPEYLGQSISNPAFLVPGENWAAALCFLKFLGNTESPWQARIQSYFNTQHCVKPDQAVELKAEITNWRERLIQGIAKMGSSNAKEIYQACADLLTMDPAFRITMPEVERRMDRLEKRWNIIVASAFSSPVDPALTLTMPEAEKQMNQLESSAVDAIFSAHDSLSPFQTVLDESKRLSTFKEFTSKMSVLDHGVSEEDDRQPIFPSVSATSS